MATSDLFTLIVATLATIRIVRAIAVDSITEPLRRWVVTRFGLGSRIDELVTCPWCLSWWVAWFAMTVAWLGGCVSSLGALLLLAPACAWLAPVAASLMERSVHE
jgi:hypothetical protein